MALPPVFVFLARFCTEKLHVAKEAPEIINRLQAAVSPTLAMLAGMQLEVFTAVAEESRTAAELGGIRHGVVDIFARPASLCVRDWTGAR